MNSELAQYIEQLLFAQDRVIIPGLGAFVAQPAPATVDYTAESVIPPSRTLVFDDHILLDDGVLAQVVAKDKSISEAEAKQWIDRHVAQIRESLDQRDIIAFTNIGRLYRNYLQQMLFVPDASNFSRESFGLPPIQFSTLSRSREVNGNEPIAPVQVEESTEVLNIPPTTNYSKFFLIGLVLLLVGAGAFYWFSTTEGATTESDKVSENTAGIETTTQEQPEPEPTEAIESSGNISPKTPEKDTKPADNIPPKTPEKKAEPIAKTTENATQKSCVLVVGVFKDPLNIQKLKNTVKQGGFSVFTTAGKNGGTMVCATVDCSTTEIMEKNREKLRKLTGVKDIYLKK